MAKLILPHQDVKSLNAFYGDPNKNGHENPAWVRENIAYWKPPYPMFYSDDAKTPFKNGLRMNKKCFGTFTEAYTDVLTTLGPDYIKAKRLDISGGAYCFRLERGGSNLSVHSWGCAIDMDPGHNPFPKKWRQGFIDLKFAEIMQKHGFIWRGANGDIDPMHFQLATR